MGCEAWQEGSHAPAVGDTPSSVKSGEDQHLDELSTQSISDLEHSERVPFKGGVRRGPCVFGRIKQQKKKMRNLLFFFFDSLRFVGVSKNLVFFLPMTSLLF